MSSNSKLSGISNGVPTYSDPGNRKLNRGLIACEGEGCGVSVLLLFTLILLSPLVAHAQKTEQKASDSTLVIQLPAPEGEVVQAVRNVADDGIIHGTKVYEKEPILDGATAQESSDYYGKWQGGGEVYFKVRDDAIAPRHFKASADIGKITVRYVIESLSAMNTRLQIDAVFVERGGHRICPSDGTVETSEFSEIQDKVRAIEYQKKKDAEAMMAREAFDASHGTPERQRAAEIAQFAASETNLHNLEQKLHDLQHELEVRVKEPGAKLKTAPFRAATDLRTLAANDELLILIVTPHWYGIETIDGQHGWIARDQVEALP